MICALGKHTTWDGCLFSYSAIGVLILSGLVCHEGALGGSSEVYGGARYGRSYLPYMLIVTKSEWQSRQVIPLGVVGLPMQILTIRFQDSLAPCTMHTVGGIASILATHCELEGALRKGLLQPLFLATPYWSGWGLISFLGPALLGLERDQWSESIGYMCMHHEAAPAPPSPVAAPEFRAPPQLHILPS